MYILYLIFTLTKQLLAVIFQMTPFQTACLWAHNAETVAIFLEKNVAKVDDRALYLAVSEGYE